MKDAIIVIMTLAIMLGTMNDMVAGQQTWVEFVVLGGCGASLGLMAGAYFFKWWG